MPDTPVGPMPANPDLEVRVAKLEQDMGDVKSILGQMLPLVVRMDATLAHLATMAEMEAGFRALETKISELRVDMQAGDAALRDEVRTGDAALRDEIHAVDAALRTEMLAGNASLREEMRDRDSALRTEIHGLRTEMHDEFGKIRTELADKPSKVYLWMVLGALIMSYAAGLAALAVLK
jgi:DNA anti-recombination protein RmuC